MWMKECSKCNVCKSESEFHRNKKNADGLQKYCKLCKKCIDRKQYTYRTPEQRKKYREINDRARKRNQKYVVEYLFQHPCVDCGEKDILVLEFDHLRDKERNISLMIV